MGVLTAFGFVLIILGILWLLYGAGRLKLYVFALIALGALLVVLGTAQRVEAQTKPVIMLVVRACLTSDPSSCVEPAFIMDVRTEEQCWHAAPTLLPQIAAQHVDFTIKAYACVTIRPGRQI